MGLPALTIIFIICAALFRKFLNWYIQHHKFDKCLISIPGPKGFPYLGSILRFTNQKDLKNVFMQLQNEFGNTFKFKLEMKNYLVTSDPELIEALLTSNKIIDKPHDTYYLRKWLGYGLLFSKGDKWRRNRKIIAPSFHMKILEEFVPIFVQKSSKLVDLIQNNELKQFDITNLISFAALDVICETAMGVSANALKEGENSAFVRNTRFMTQVAGDRMFSPWKRFDCLYNLSPDAWKESQVVKEFNELTKLIINERKLLYDKNQNEKGRKLAFLDLLLTELEENGGHLTEKDVTDEINNFMFAGYHTISTTLCFAFHLIANNSQVQEKLYEEFQSINNDLCLSNLHGLKYTEMVIKETLRLYPPAYIIGRQLNDDFIWRDLIVPKGSQFCTFIYGAHRNPIIYPNPEVFDPERFTPENMAQRSTFSYIPFSVGPRNCIGHRFAMAEMKVILYMIINKFKIRPVHNRNFKVIGDVLLKPDNGVYLDFELRSNN